jgi:hypothetical protein
MALQQREWRDIIEGDLIEPLKIILRDYDKESYNAEDIRDRIDAIIEILQALIFEINEELGYMEEQTFGDQVEEGEIEDWAEARYGAMNEWYEERSIPLTELVERLDHIKNELSIAVIPENFERFRDAYLDIENLDIPNRYE